MSDAQQFGPTVRKLRLAKGLKQTEVAEGSGIKIRGMSRIELGERQPTLDTALKISRYLEQQTGVAILTMKPKDEVE